jgi:hypothetical protein
MHKLNISKLKKVAKRSADCAAREQADLIAEMTPADRTDHRQAVAKAIEANIDGIAPLNRAIEALQAKSAVKTMKEEKKRAARAVKLGRARKTILANMISQRVRAFEALVEAVDVPSAQRYLVNTPFEIVGSALNFDSFAIVPSNSWVKFRMERRNTPQRRYASVIFRFVWENTQDKYVVINANGYMILHGHCYAFSDGGIFGGDRSAKLEIRPTLQLFDWTNEPNLTLGTEQVLAVAVHTNTGAIWDDEAEDPEDVFRGYDLAKYLILVPPRTAVGLVMSAEIQYYAGKNSGVVQANFSDGSFMVGSPAVLVTVVS